MKNNILIIVLISLLINSFKIVDCKSTYDYCKAFSKFDTANPKEKPEILREIDDSARLDFKKPSIQKYIKEKKAQRKIVEPKEEKEKKEKEAIKTSLNFNINLSTIRMPKPQKQQFFGQLIEKIKKSYPNLNAEIPIKAKNILRIMNFNVHAWSGPEEQSGFWKNPKIRGNNYLKIMNLIKLLNPDIVVLEEIEYRKDRKEITINDDVKKLGYNILYSPANRADFGNAILFKNNLKIQAQFKEQFGNLIPKSSDFRSFAKIELILPGIKKVFAVYGVHFEVNTQKDPQIRLKEAKKLVSRIKKYDSNKYVLILADFNENKKGQSWTYLENNGFKNAFDFFNIPYPEFTHWSGHVIDGILLSTNWNLQELPVDGVYVYYTNLSDHMPIILDIKI